MAGLYLLIRLLKRRVTAETTGKTAATALTATATAAAAATTTTTTFPEHGWSLPSY